MSKGLKLEELCRGICSVSQLSKIETGKAQATDSQVQEFASRFGVPVGALQGEDFFAHEVEEQIQLSRKAFHLKKPEQSFAILKRLRESIDPEKRRDLYVKVVLDEVKNYKALSQWQEVAETLQELLPYDSHLSAVERFELWGLLGVAYVRMKQVEQGCQYYRKAQAAFDECLLEDPKYMKLYYMKSDQLFTMGDYREALRCAEIALRMSQEPEYSLEWRIACQGHVATAASKLGLYEESAKHFQAVVAEAAANQFVFQEALYLTNLGLTYLVMGRMSEGREVLHKSLSRMELVQDVQNGFFWCMPYLIFAKYHVSMGEYRTAEEYLSRADEILKSSPQGAAYLTQGVACEIWAESAKRQGKTSEQIQHLREALRIYEEHQAPREAFERAAELADLLEERGDAEALEMYRLSLQYARKYDRIFAG
ncbi:hypothetical protein EL26_03985 [Tumebacillus flagellatus]|uniref:HTH cro/C1-type domain-containing protein n=1 Tax=Tumebacillus flagellatus TaxID=1157490 RepID=A0A074MG57_9BACL|nr:hypothetical protein EL26_03985 [Tumebacillus flagellatus]